jgi:hypothetical protein
VLATALSLDVAMAVTDGLGSEIESVHDPVPMEPCATAGSGACAHETMDNMTDVVPAPMRSDRPSSACSARDRDHTAI